MDTTAIMRRKNELLRDQMRMIDRQRKEIERLRQATAELEELIELKDRYINEIYREHFANGGKAINIEHERIADNGIPLMLCYSEIPNGEYTTIVRIGR